MRTLFVYLSTSLVSRILMFAKMKLNQKVGKFGAKNKLKLKTWLKIKERRNKAIKFIGVSKNVSKKFLTSKNYTGTFTKGSSFISDKRERNLVTEKPDTNNGYADVLHDVEHKRNFKRKQKKKRKKIKESNCLNAQKQTMSDAVACYSEGSKDFVNSQENTQVLKKKKRRKRKRKSMLDNLPENEKRTVCSNCLKNAGEDDGAPSLEASLPVNACQKELINYIKMHSTLIVISETGAGKTTQIPQIIYKNIVNKTGTIAITQPRRVAVLSISSRVAQELNSEIGDVVGYSIRFDTVRSENTRIVYQTDGMLSREFFSDKMLLSYDYVILDEAHERTVHTDVLFGLVKNAQKCRSKRNLKPLKIIIMSATMDVDQYSKYFGNAPVIYLEGRTFPIKVYHIKNEEEDYVTACLTTFFKLHRSAPANHDVLIILTGQNEIEAMAYKINSIANGLFNYPKIIVCTLYASMDPYKQQNVFLPTPKGCRKVILSTNIAETSVTISGIKYVIDSGKVKAKTYDSVTGIEALKVQTISQAQAWQRAGRAGRQSEGFVYRLYTVNQYEKMEHFPVPEIQRCNLTGVVLYMLHMKINPFKFDFLDKPRECDIEESVNQLVELGAVRMDDEKLRVLEIGHQMALLPLDPKYSKILISSPSYGCVSEVITVIAFLSTDSIFINPTGSNNSHLEARAKFSSPHGDLITFLNVYKAYKSLRENKKDWCRRHCLNKFNIQYAFKVREQLIMLCRDVLHLEVSSCGDNTESLIKCLLTGLYRNVAVLKSKKTYFTINAKRPAKIHPGSVLADRLPTSIVYCEVIQLNELYLKNVTVIDTDWLQEVVPICTLKKKPSKDDVELN